MARKLVTEGQLVEWLNERLHSEPDNESYEIIGVGRLQGNDQDGCNWYGPIVRGHGAPVALVLDFVRQIESEAKKLFNITE